MPDPEDPAREKLLDAAERVFYARGIQAVGMDELRAAAGLPLKRIYQLYPGKDDLVVAFLRRRHIRMMTAIRTRTGQSGDPVLALFDWLGEWFSEPGFRGCAWLNAYGELGPTNAGVAGEARRHKQEFRALLTGLASGYPDEVAHAVYLLAEGAIAAAAVTGTPEPAFEARRIAETLLRNAR
ncbi:TetR/AcrR family transcriptional regulator [Amycolatopsis minnesotensis]|uniref:TetR/AcrR family transcriptional regulator n=1 Tax=Amycolatopsis minnesotensis TaxID=337894 RepID=A0ABN2S1K3_9PSEU